MKKTYQNIFGASLALATFSFIGNASAQSCVTPPTCASLGYNMTETDCKGHSFLKCPFNLNIGYCDLGAGNKKSCSDGGYSAIKISGQNCTTVSYEELTCYSCSVAKTCADGGYSQIQISGQNCKKVTYQGLTCYQCSAKSCADMGYKLNSPKGRGWSCTACPTDPRKYSCSEIPCPDLSAPISCLVLDPDEIAGYSGDDCCWKLF